MLQAGRSWRCWPTRSSLPTPPGRPLPSRRLRHPGTTGCRCPIRHTGRRTTSARMLKIPRRLQLDRWILPRSPWGMGLRRQAFWWHPVRRKVTLPLNRMESTGKVAGRSLSGRPGNRPVRKPHRVPAPVRSPCCRRPPIPSHRRLEMWRPAPWVGIGGGATQRVYCRQRQLQHARTTFALKLKRWLQAG